jgi:hypothetical protein
MIGENSYRYGFHIFYTQVNWAGNAPGYVGTEFPLVSFLAACLYGIFGIRKVSNVRSALPAVAIYILYAAEYFCRSRLHDMTTLSLSIMALVHGSLRGGLCFWSGTS